MAIYTNIKDISYPFLHDAVLVVDKYTEGVNRVRVTSKGECCITIKGMVCTNTLKRVMKDLDPNVTSESSIEDYNPKMYEDYDYADSGIETYVYTKDGLDYREL